MKQEKDPFITKLDIMIQIHNKRRDSHIKDRDSAAASAQYEVVAVAALEDARNAYFETMNDDETEATSHETT